MDDVEVLLTHRDGLWVATVTISVGVVLDEDPTWPGYDEDDSRWWAEQEARRRALDALSGKGRPKGRPKGIPNSRMAASCERCGVTFSAGRAGTRFCSGRCRVAAHRAGDRRSPRREIPPEIAAQIVEVEQALRRR